MFMDTFTEDDSEDSFIPCWEVKATASTVKQDINTANITKEEEQKKFQELFDKTHSEDYFDYNYDWILQEDKEERYLDQDTLEQQ